MTNYFPVVIEQESNGTFSAWVAGLPGVYAAADTRAKAKSAIRDAAMAHLQALKELGKSVKPRADVLLLKGRSRPRARETGIHGLCVDAGAQKEYGESPCRPPERPQRRTPAHRRYRPAKRDELPQRKPPHSLPCTHEWPASSRPFDSGAYSRTSQCEFSLTSA